MPHRNSHTGSPWQASTDKPPLDPMYTFCFFFFYFFFFLLTLQFFFILLLPLVLFSTTGVPELGTPLALLPPPRRPHRCPQCGPSTFPGGT